MNQGLASKRDVLWGVIVEERHHCGGGRGIKRKCGIREPLETL